MTTSANSNAPADGRGGASNSQQGDAENTRLYGANSHVTPFADAWSTYLDGGWGVLPLDPRSKGTPPAGTTGGSGVDLTPDQLARWANVNADGNIAVRLPHNVVGLDVDDYGDKHGAANLEA